MTVLQAQDYMKKFGLEVKIPKIYKLESFLEINDVTENMTQYEQGIVIKFIGRNSSVCDDSTDNNVYIRSKIRNDYYNYVKDSWLFQNIDNISSIFLCHFEELCANTRFYLLSDIQI